MASPDPENRPGSYSTPPKKRRRFSVWTLLAPAAVLLLWISFFTALGDSCILKECDSKASESAASTEDEDKRNEFPKGTKSKVKEGDTLGSIAAKFHLTEEELKACNPRVDPQTLQPGQYLTVSAIDCEDADRAEAGADPDPLAGDTAPKPVENGTAAADPSVDAAANDAKAGN